MHSYYWYIFFGSIWDTRARGFNFFCSGREECIYALTGKPLFEIKTGNPLYGVGLAVLESLTEYRLNQSLPRGHTSFAALIEVPLFLTFKLCALTLSYSPHNHSWFMFHTNQLLSRYVYILIWLPHLLTITSMREQ